MSHVNNKFVKVANQGDEPTDGRFSKRSLTDAGIMLIWFLIKSL